MSTLASTDTYIATILETPFELAGSATSRQGEVGFATVPPPEPSEAGQALWTNRVPDHEPWPRTLMCQPMKDSSATQAYEDSSGMFYESESVPERQSVNRHHSPEFPSGSAWVGRAEGNEEIYRGPLWRR